jgi:hypothetical protein
VVFGAGLGGPIDDEFGSFGDMTDLEVLAGRPDEGLALLAPTARPPTPSDARDAGNQLRGG